MTRIGNSRSANRGFYGVEQARACILGGRELPKNPVVRSHDTIPSADLCEDQVFGRSVEYRFW
jgi:hypothetical protein